MGYRKKDRPLTQILQAVGDETLPDSEVRNKEHLAANMWTLATQGKITFPDGRELKASVKDWKDSAQWIYTHCDGPFRIDDSITEGITGQLQSKSLDELRSIIHETRTGPDAEPDTEVPENTEG